MISSHKRNILIIGGSGGLGSELSRIFLHSGDRVAIHYFKNKAKTIAIINEAGLTGETDEAFPCPADLRLEKSVEEMFREIKKRWTHLDILINSEGITADALLLRMTENQWHEILQVNLTGLFFCMKHGGQWMRSNKKGHVINIGSRGGLTGRIGQANYTASKAGVIGLTKSASMEWGADQIQVNAVLPGFLPTEIGSKLDPSMQNRIILENSLRRGSTLEEVSQFVYFLSRMENVSGQVFNLDSRII